MELTELARSLPTLAGKDEAITQICRRRKENDVAYREELLALEKKYHSLNLELYQKRHEITKDVPNYWRIVLSNHPTIESVLTAEDKEALSYLLDIRLSYIDSSPSYCLEFVFAPNPYFDNEILSKKMVLSNNEDLENVDFSFENSEGTLIRWKEGKSICFKRTAKTQRNKKTGATRETTVETAIPSFFHFFGDAKYIMPNELNEDPEEFGESIDAEMEIADIFKCSIVPDALVWFMNEKEDYSDDEDYDSEDSSDSKSKVSDLDSPSPPNPSQSEKEAQCKQQ